MSRTAYSGSLYWAVLYLPLTCFAQGDDVVQYAKECYRALGNITETEMEIAFGGSNYACRYNATKLTTKQGTIALDPANPAVGLTLAGGTKNFLTACNAPAWLP